MKNARQKHVCLITLLSPILLSTGALAQTRRNIVHVHEQFSRVGTQIRQPRGKPFLGGPLPREVTRMPLRKTRANAIPQTADLTANTPTVNDTNPSIPRSANATNEVPIVFQSNRTDLNGTQAGVSTHIYRMEGDGSGVTALTGPLAPGQIGQNSSQSEPAFNSTATTVVYIDTVGGAPDIIELNLNTRVTKSLTKNNPNGFAFDALNHPEYGVAPGRPGVGVVFAGRLNGTTNFHLFAVDVAGGSVTQLTAGIADDRNPTLGPDTSQPVLAFDSNRGNPNGTTIVGTRNVWAMDANNPFAPAKQVTTAVGSDNIEPAWSTNKVDQPGGTQHPVNGQTLLAFASTRNVANGTHDIWWLKVNVSRDPNNSNLYTVVNPFNPNNPPEAANNPALQLDTSDPGHIYDDRHPTWPQFITSYRVTYHTNRTSFSAGSGQSSPPSDPASQNDIFSSTLIDLNAPALVRFSEITGDILDVQPRQAVPGGTVTIQAKVQDLETGVRDVWVQIKNPNSKYQSSDNKEHKVYLFVGLTPDNSNTVVNVPVEYDSEPIFIGTNPADPRFNTYPRTDPTQAEAPFYTAGIDDFFAYSGAANPPNERWLKLQFDSKDPVTGVATYKATWQTDNNPSDYLIDVIVYDNALNPFSTGPFDAGVNWKIYDNVHGFSTATFQAQHNILFVSDNAQGQKFFNSRFGVNTLVNVFNSFWGTESWMTDIAVSLFPTQYTSGTIGRWVNTLGVGAFADGGNDGSFIDGRPVPPTTQYDLWRVQCRGPVPDSVLAQYAPHIETQPPDTLGGETQPRSVTVAQRCVIWHAPYAGSVFTGAGAITDLQVQIQLHSFLSAGGRLLVNGQDVAWALTLDGGLSNSFVTNDLRAQYVTDALPGVLYRFPGSGFFPFNLLVSGFYRFQVSGAGSPISFDPWFDPTRNLQAGHCYPGPPFGSGCDDNLSADPEYYMAGESPTNVHDLACPGAFFPDSVRPLNAVSDFRYSNGDTAVQHYADTSTQQRVVFSSMGMEGLSDDVYAPPNSQNLLFMKGRRAELMHNIVCWLRTGSIVGEVRDLNGGNPLANVLVRLSNHAGKIDYTGLTNTEGKFAINGVEPGAYEVTAVKPGFLIQRRTFATTHGGYFDQIAFRLTQAEPATIKGKVTRTDGTTPVVGATVTAAGNDPNNPITINATSDANGDYAVERVPAGITYTLTVTAAGFGASIPVSYTVPNPNDPIAGQRDTVVQPAKVYLGFNFQLKPIPGTVTGRVIDGANNAGIPGAVVTATLGNVSATATTDANGNYTLSNLDPGVWGLVAVAPGYGQNNPAVNVTVISNQNVVAPDIVLNRIPPGSISGLITRSTDSNALAGVQVVVKDPAGSIQATTTTGPLQIGPGGYRFNYKFDNVPAGVTYTVIPTLAGYTAVPLSKQAPVTSNLETKDINFQMDPLHTFPGSLSMVSAPYDYAGTDVADLLSIPQQDRDGVTFRFATWELGGYVFYPANPAREFRLGRGYFLGYKNNIPLATVGTAANPNLPFTLPLNPGWNMIGDPFLINLDWTKIKVVYNNQTYAHDQAIAAGLIGPALYSYLSGGYVLDFQLVPWKGYWVRAFKSVQLVIDPTTDGRAAAIAGGVTRAVLQGGTGWSVNLRLNVGNLRDEDNYLGVSTRAIDGFDGFKAQKPPLFSDRYAYLTFDHDNWGDKSAGYGIDVRSANSAAKSWEFSVQTTEANATAVLSWPNAATVGRNVNLTLTDLSSGTVRDLRSNSSYAWQTGDKPVTRRFRIDVVGATNSGSLRITNVTTSVPPGRSAANISYEISAPAQVEIRILSSNGNLVRRLSGRGASRAAGANQALWDQKNDQGALMPSGVYMVEVKAQSADGKQNARQAAPLILIR